MYHVIFSADMADTSLFEKIGARHTQYSQRDIETAFNKHTAHKEVQEEVIQALKTHYPYTIFDFTSALTPKHIESTLRNLKDAGYCPQIAFIDYAGRVIGEHDNQYQNATEIALESNDIAKRTSTHLCFVSQVPREQGDHTTPLRNSRVSKDSGSWEENATIVINMWRPFGNGIEVDDNYIHLYVAKNRSGALGEHVFWWEGKTGEIRAISEAEFETYKNLCLEYKRETPIDQFQYRDKDIDKLIETGKFKPKNEPEEEDDEDEGMDGGRSKVSNNRERKRSRRSSRFSD